MAGKRRLPPGRPDPGDLAATEPGRDGREEPTKTAVSGSSPEMPLRSPAAMAGKRRTFGVVPVPGQSPLRSPAAMAGKRARPIRSGTTGASRYGARPRWPGRAICSRTAPSGLVPLRSPAAMAGKSSSTGSSR